MRQTKIDTTAHIEEGVEICDGVQIWDQVHIRHGARIGAETSVGEKSYIAYDVVIGSRVKINAMVYICAGVTIEDMCMISAGTVFTNDLFPRAMNRDLTALETSAPTEQTLATFVQQGVTIGANATIGPGITLGAFSMIGMGSVVTHDVPSHALVVGNPARIVGYVCVCGPRIVSSDALPDDGEELICQDCRRRYWWKGGQLMQQQVPCNG